MSISLFLIVIIASLVSPVFAPWGGYATSGTWDSSTLGNLQASGANDGRVNATTSSLTPLADGDGYAIDVYIENINGTRTSWWDLEAVKRFYFRLDITDSTNHVWVMFYLAAQDGLLYDTASDRVGVGNVEMADLFAINPSYAGKVFNIQVIRVGDTTCMVTYRFYRSETSFKVYTENFTVPVGFWASLDALMYAGHDGSGNFEISITEISTEASIAINHDPTEEGGALTNVRDIIAMLVGLFVQLGALAVGLMPVLPVLVLFWLIDAVIASVESGSVQPIGAVFTFIIEGVQAIGVIIVGALQAIAEAIPL